MMTALERISQRVGRNGDVNDQRTPRPLLTLDEFFVGNDVVGSIGCNLVPPPSPAAFHQMLESIAARPTVADVRMSITAFDDPDWPFSDQVWIITSSPREDVASWFPESLRPDEIGEGWPEQVPMEKCHVPEGMRAVVCVWD